MPASGGDPGRSGRHWPGSGRPAVSRRGPSRRGPGWSATWSRPLLFVGARWALEEGARVAGVRLPDLQPVSSAEEVEAPFALLDLDIVVPGFHFGGLTRAAAKLAVQAVETAARLCLEGSVAGMVTCPIHKEAIHAAGYVNDIGHQEILARLAGTSRGRPRC